MNGRQKIEAAFSSQGSPEFGVVICYEGIYVRDHWRQLTRHPWYCMHSPDLAQRMDAWREIITAIDQDWMALAACPGSAYRKSHRIQVQPDGVYLVNESGGATIALEDDTVDGWKPVDPGYSGHAQSLARTPDEIDLLIPPLPPFDSQHFISEGHADLARLQLEAFGPDRYPIRHVSSPLWECFGLWGFEGMMTMIRESPELVRYACERYLSYSLRRVHEAAALGAAGLWIEECLTDLIHPDDFRELNLPYIRAIVEEIHALGLHGIYYYCGSPRRKLDLLFEAGADALALEESKKGFAIDIDEIAEASRGRCALLGNLDAINLLPSASEGELRAEIARQVAAGRRNRHRFVMSIGSPVTPGTSAERVRQYCAWARELGS